MMPAVLLLVSAVCLPLAVTAGGFNGGSLLGVLAAGAAIALTLRFIPAISGRSDVLRLAHLARSPKRPGWRLVTPLAIGTLDEADQAADALRARAHIE